MSVAPVTTHRRMICLLFAIWVLCLSVAPNLFITAAGSENKPGSKEGVTAGHVGGLNSEPAVFSSDGDMFSSSTSQKEPPEFLQRSTSLLGYQVTARNVSAPRAALFTRRDYQRFGFSETPVSQSPADPDTDLFQEDQFISLGDNTPLILIHGIHGGGTQDVAASNYFFYLIRYLKNIPGFNTKYKLYLF